MDRNSIAGLVLIGVILFGWFYLTAPTEEELAEQKRVQDSIALANEMAAEKANQAMLEEKLRKDSANVLLDSAQIAQSDSARNAKMKNLHGDLANALSGEEQFLEIENQVLRLKLTNKGGFPVEAELKKYKSYDSTSLLLFDQDSSSFAFDFNYNGRNYSTSDLYFEPNYTATNVSGDSNTLQVAYRAYVGNQSKYIEMLYTIKGNDYLLDYDVNFVGLQDVLSTNNNTLTLNWQLKSLTKEKGLKQERATTSAYWKFKNQDVDYISESSYSVEDEFEEPLHWVSFKQQFFSAVLIADNEFSPVGTSIATASTEGSTRYVEGMNSKLTVPFTNGSANFQWYLGPNKYNLIKNYDLDLEDQINLGWGIFGWVNKFLIIPVFDVFDSFNWNYGLIIIALTILIKGVLFPFTYKTYLSSARQKVLKPEMEALNEKFKDAEPMKKQQATMKLYQEAGVNPMAGCVPQLLQLPILYAMFRFFPAAIELRGQSFLWAEDLSTYDAIFTWSQHIPVLSSVYGNHVSLFTLLMATSTFFYTKYNSSMTMTSGPQAQQMKIIMYMMPVMLLGFFNNYASGLSLYYFAANLFTIIQQLVIKRFFIDEEAIHAKIKQNMENPNKKKSRFQKKMDEMMKQQQNQKKKK